MGLHKQPMICLALVNVTGCLHCTHFREMGGEVVKWVVMLETCVAMLEKCVA
jgi:hypothetical protein